MGLDISIFAKSTLAILAIVVLFVFLLGANNPELIHTGVTLFTWLILAVIIVTIIINLPRYANF